MKYHRFGALFAIVGAGLAACPGATPDVADATPTAAAVEDPYLLRPMNPRDAAALEPVGAPIKAILTSPPEVPPPTGRTEPAKVVVELDVIEVVKEIADGTEYVFWTYGGDVPGKMIRVRQGDTVEFHLRNDPTSKLPHNIDLHAVSGQGGGAAATATAPGHESVFTFKALNAGLFVYHCATGPVPMHIANGMYGLILVEPPEGLPPVDKEYYVMQGDFYTVGEYHAGGLQVFDTEKATNEEPTYVLFNGREGSLLGDAALDAEVGDSVRIYFGVGGPNLTSSFHVIGDVFDRVYEEGGMRYQEQVQTTFVPAGGSVIVDYTVDVPAKLVLVDHSLSRAFNKGAIGMMEVTGEEDVAVYSGKQQDNLWAGTGREVAAAPTDPLAHGEQVFGTSCAMCHQPDGTGVAGAFPPLAGSDWVAGDAERLIAVPLFGLSGPIDVNGKSYNGTMPAIGSLSDTELANALTYVRKSWGNKGAPITAEQVAAVRAKGPTVASAAPVSKDGH